MSAYVRTWFHAETKRGMADVVKDEANKLLGRTTKTVDFGADKVIRAFRKPYAHPHQVTKINTFINIVTKPLDVNLTVTYIAYIA
jgi:hypothetical protein